MYKNIHTINAIVGMEQIVVRCPQCSGPRVRWSLWPSPYPLPSPSPWWWWLLLRRCTPPPHYPQIYP